MALLAPTLSSSLLVFGAWASQSHPELWQVHGRQSLERLAQQTSVSGDCRVSRLYCLLVVERVAVDHEVFVPESQVSSPA